MGTYEPIQGLKLVYQQNDKIVKVVSNISVSVDENKTLTRKVAESTGLADYLIEYLVKDHAGNLRGNTFKDLVEFDILSNWSPDNSLPIEKQVEEAIKADLIKKNVPFYRVKTVVYLENGSTGGKVTTTISDNGDIVID